jgi:activator of Hsp90 ATPase-like protein
MSSVVNHRVGIKASPIDIYKALTQTEKLAQWWTTDTKGSGAKIGDALEFWFGGDLCQKFNIIELEFGERVAWKSQKGQAMH